MERKNYSQKEIALILKELSHNLTVDEATQKYQISKATIYRWRKQSQKIETQQVSRLKLVDEENTRLKHLLAEAALEIQSLKLRLT
ncbi:MAG: transposase [Sneathiella sp.]